jgi:phage terminase large subunit
MAATHQEKLTWIKLILGEHSTNQKNVSCRIYSEDTYQSLYEQLIPIIVQQKVKQDASISLSKLRERCYLLN